MNAPEGNLELTLQADPGAAVAVPRVTIFDARGQVVVPEKPVSFRDRQLRYHWKVSTAGDFFLRLRDLQHGARGGPEFVYQLTVVAARPDFALTTSTDVMNIVQGGSGELEIVAHRYGGFNEAIQLAVSRLPEGTKVEGGEISAGKDRTKLKLTISKKAPSRLQALRITGRAEISGRPVDRAVAATHLGVDEQGVATGPATRPSIQLNVMHTPVFRMFCSEAYLYAHRGSIFPYSMQLERLGGFDGDIVLQIGDRQNRDLDGIEMIEVTVPPGETTTKLPIYLPETMHINVQSQSQLYCQAYASFVDSFGKQQSVLVVSEKRNMLRTLPPVIKLAADTPEISANPGQRVVCRLTLDRTSNFPGPMQLRGRTAHKASRLVLPDVKIAAGQTRINVPLDLPANLAPQIIPVTFRATGPLASDPEVIIVTEATVNIKVVKSEN